MSDGRENPIRLFVFGTLKAGYPLHQTGLAGAACHGAYRTAVCYPLIIAGPWFAPMMFDEPGEGLHVRGELYLVDEPTLARLDALESVGTPGHHRTPIDVESLSDDSRCSAFAYMKDRSLADPVHSGCLGEYSDRRFIPPDRRTAGEQFVLQAGTITHLPTRAVFLLNDKDGIVNCEWGSASTGDDRAAIEAAAARLVRSDRSSCL